VTTALRGIRGVPSGWKATALSALNAIQMRLGDEGKASLASYVNMAIALVTNLTGDTP
jgi:hypothetical protein